MALSEKDLPIIVEELSNATSKWFNIGIQFNLEFDKLERIRNDHKDIADNCFPHMIVAWLRSSSQVPKTWSTLANVLKRQCIGFGELAAEIEEKYCQLQSQHGEKRPHPSDESESATVKRPHLEKGYNYDDIKKSLPTSDRHIQELLLTQNRRLNRLEDSKKDQDVRIQALEEANNNLKKENAKLKQEHSDLKKENAKLKQEHSDLKKENAKLEHSDIKKENAKLKKEHSKLEKQVKEQSGQLQQLTAKIQSEISNTQGDKAKPNLRIDEIDNNILWIRAAPHDVRDDWEELGREFEVSLEFLDNVKSKHGENSQECLFWVVREWLKQLVVQGDTECKTCKLIEVLESPRLTGNHGVIASTLDDMCHHGCPARGCVNEYGRFYPFS